jgi:hypothetical protein
MHVTAEKITRSYVVVRPLLKVQNHANEMTDQLARLEVAETGLGVRHLASCRLTGN